MSYCRWSTDDFRCDLYVYGASDGVVIHVASHRRDIPEAAYPAPLPEEPFDAEAYLKRHYEVMALIDGAPLVPIGLPHDGASWSGLTESEAAERVRELVALGYRCPGYVADELESEAAEAPREEGATE